MEHRMPRRRAISFPPRWVIRLIWRGHRALYRVSGGRRGLALPEEGGRFGMLRLHTTGRRSGRERVAILGYCDDGDRLVTLAMNGWGDTAPAWWLNLLDAPEATVDLVSGRRTVRARAAAGEERDRLWARLEQFRGYGSNPAEVAARRPVGTPVVVFEPA